jgi:hypothetical protein
MITHCSFHFQLSHSLIVRNFLFYKGPGTKHLSIDIATILSDWSMSILGPVCLGIVLDYNLRLFRFYCQSQIIWFWIILRLFSHPCVTQCDKASCNIHIWMKCHCKCMPIMWLPYWDECACCWGVVRVITHSSHFHPLLVQNPRATE